jgi:polygalacturonase
MDISLEQLTLCRTGQYPVTQILQATIDRIADSGGGTLTVTPGIYLTGTLVLPSNFCLRLETGAVLKASADEEDYQNVTTRTEAEQSRTALLYAYQATQITIQGNGIIDGSGEDFFLTGEDDQGYRMPRTPRPRILVFEACTHIHLTQFMIQQAPMWTVHLVHCQHVHIDQLTIDNDLTMPNTDALDLDSCQHVTVTGCHFSAGDDDICLKTTDKLAELQQTTAHIMISDCLFRSKSCAIKFGSETFADIQDVHVHHCIIYESNRGIGLFSRDGGSISHCSFDHIHFDCHYATACHWGQADPVFISVRPRTSATPSATISHIEFDHLSGCAEGAINLHADPVGSVSAIRFNQIDFIQQFSPEHIDALYDIRPPCNPERPTGQGLDNAYRLNDETGVAFGLEYYPHGMPGLFAQGIDELTLTDIHIQRPKPLPLGWNTETVYQIQNCVTD